jgi:hypothetical protein
MADAYRKVGRGGAGNFYSLKDIEDVEKAAQAKSDADPEAQKPSPADELPSDPGQGPSTTAPASSSSPLDAATAGYARTGRGGAGNFVEPVVSAAAQIAQHAQPRPATVHSTGNQSSAPAAPPRQPATTGHSGRGGAGNWTSDDSQRAYEEEADHKRRAALDAKVVDDVTAGLREPGRAVTRYNPHRRAGPGNGAGGEFLDM